VARPWEFEAVSGWSTTLIRVDAAAILCDGLCVKSATIPFELHRLPAREGAGEDLLSFWVGRCDKFMERQRKDVLERDPSPEELADHVGTLKFMIRVTLLLQALFADPDSPAHQSALAISGKLLQLQESLKLLQNPMTDSEADAILETAFPDGRRAGSAA
jgi:hypothetical protein